MSIEELLLELENHPDFQGIVVRHNKERFHVSTQYGHQHEPWETVNKGLKKDQMLRLLDCLKEHFSKLLF